MKLHKKALFVATVAWIPAYAGMTPRGMRFFDSENRYLFWRAMISF